VNAGEELEESSRDAVAMPTLRQTWRRRGRAAEGATIKIRCALEDEEWSVLRPPAALMAQPEAPGARHAWRAAKRQPRQAEAAADSPAAHAPSDGANVSAAALTAVGAAGAGGLKPKKPKKPVPAYKGRVDPDAESSSSDGVESDPGEDRDYPLPGSTASCDGCSCNVRRYYHCIQCGVDESAFDLCLRCHRGGYYTKEHMRTFPHHDLEIVTPKSAPITRKPPPKPSPGGGVQPNSRNGAFGDDMMKRALPPPRGAEKFNTRNRALVKVEVPLEANTKYSWTQTDGEINLMVKLPPGVRRREIGVEIRPLLLRILVRGHTLLAGSLDKPIVASESTWTFEPGELQVMLPKETHGPMFSRLFPSEEKLQPAMALKQVCEDEPYQGRYMDLTPEARRIVDLHRNFNHARATGKEDWAQELEEEMKMMRFSWGKDNKDDWEIEDEERRAAAAAERNLR